MREKIDLESYLVSRVAVKNATYGSRGYDQGVRTFDCPLCGDDKERGWMNVERWTAGCFRAGCEAEPRLRDALEWVRLVEKFPHNGKTWKFLFENHRRTGLPRKLVLPTWDNSVSDFCRLPFMRHISGDKLAGTSSVVKNFLERQWGLTLKQAATWGLGYCLAGRYEGRIIIPIRMGGKVVAFQARSYNRREPKYLNSIAGPESDPKSECSRPTRAVLFNVDGVKPGEEILLVEGVGDVMGWHKNNPTRWPHAIALLGMGLTPEKTAMLIALKPKRIIVGLDAEREALKRAKEYVRTLSGHHLDAVVGMWEGGKDAGSGATLKILPEQDINQKVKAILH